MSDPPFLPTVRDRLGPLDPGAVHHMVTMPDGTRLATDVYLPHSRDESFGTILIRVPYDKTGRYIFIPQVAHAFTARGYAVVAQDVRGKYRSEGVAQPFINEAEDGFATVDWIITQPWSNGAVGTWGDSYYGFTQWALASRKHPAHRAMVLRMTGPDFFTMRPGHGMPTMTLLGWLAEAWTTDRLMAHATNPRAMPPIEMVNPELGNGRRLLEQFLRVADDPREYSRRVYPSGDPAAQLTIPALHISGWFDILAPWHLAAWARATRSPATAHQFLRMGTQDHEDIPWRAPGTPAGPDVSTDDDALLHHVERLVREPADFFDHYLRHGVTAPWREARVRYATIGTDIETETRSWPPPHTGRVVLHPTRTGTLSTADPSSAVVSWRHDPADPVPFLIADEWGPNRIGLPDESRLLLRPDVISFTEPTALEARTILGPVTLNGSVNAVTTTTHFVARLYDKAPDGTCRLIVSNAVEVDLRSGWTDFELHLGDTAYHLPVGHRLVLALSSSLAGRYPVHPGTDEDPWTARHSAPCIQQFRLGNSRLSVTLA